jgi:hypothetical protein
MDMTYNAVINYFKFYYSIIIQNVNFIIFYMGVSRAQSTEQ